MTWVLSARDVRRKYQSDSHRVRPRLRHVHRRLELVAELDLAGLRGDHLHQRQLYNQLLRLRLAELTSLQVPASSLQEEPLDVAAELQLLLHLRRRRDVRNLCEQGGPVKRPPLRPGARLYERRQIRLWYVQAGQPDHRGFRDQPLFVLLVPLLEVLDPTSERLQRSRAITAPPLRQLAYEQLRGHLIQILRHTDFALQRL